MQRLGNAIRNPKVRSACYIAVTAVIWWILWEDLRYLAGNKFYPLRTAHVVQTGGVS